MSALVAAACTFVAGGTAPLAAQVPAAATLEARGDVSPAPRDIPAPRLGDSAISMPIPVAPAGLGGAPAAGARFAHTPGLTWDLDVLPYEGHERVQRYVSYFTGGARDKFAEWLGRGARYDAMIRAKLRAGGLPEDLTYLALVESGYDPHAISRTRAVGMWQFMPQTARDVGLRVDGWVDERRDPVRATDAAVRMLGWLKGQFGSFFVAAAAYNGGPGRVSRGLAQLASVDAPGSAVGDARFFALVDRDVIHDETKNYVPQLIAAALVAKEAPRYGLRPRAAAAPFAYDTVRVPALTPLAAVAAATRSSRAELLDLNPHYLRGLTPPGGESAVRVPAGRGPGAAGALVSLGQDVARAFRSAVTGRRETWGALAERVGAPRAALQLFNGSLATVARGRARGRLVEGQPVRVPTEAVLSYARAGMYDGDGPGATTAPTPLEPAELAQAARRHAAKAGSRAASHHARGKRRR